MLVLTRRIGERVAVPSCDVTIEVLRISGSRVRLGVTAPRTTEVHRGEVVVQAHRARIPQKDSATPFSSVPRLVLLADSDARLVGLYQQFLVGRGLRTRVVHNALDCVNQLRDETPDVLVLDPVLPWGGGDGVLAMMRQDETVPTVPTLVHCWRPGYVHFSTEAFQAFPVVRQVTRLLGLTQMEDELHAIIERFELEQQE